MEPDFTAFEEKGMKRFYRSSGLSEPEEIRVESIAQIMSTMDFSEECKVLWTSDIRSPHCRANDTLYDLRKKEGQKGFSTVASEQQRFEGASTPGVPGALAGRGCGKAE